MKQLKYSFNRKLNMMTLERAKGLSLVEVALTLLIVGVVMAGALFFVSVQYQGYKRHAEQKQLNQIKQALIQYAIDHGRLPCPDDDGDGQQQTLPNQPACGQAPVGSVILGTDQTALERVAVGGLPYKDLNVPARDVYGSPYDYVVTLHYADFESNQKPRGEFRDPTPYPFDSVAAYPRSVGDQNKRCDNAPQRVGRVRPTFTLCSKGSIYLAKRSAGVEVVVAESMPFAVISKGRDKQAQAYPRDNPLFDRVVWVDDGQNAYDDQWISESPLVLSLALLDAGVLP